MTSVAVRLFAFSVLPALLALLHVRLSRGQDRVWKIEVFLIYLFILGVGAGGLSGFFGHVFVPDTVADSIGWARGSHFQQEMGFANLALGVLGFIAASRRDGFREATVIAVSVLAVGASVVHVLDIIETTNFAPGNSLQIIGNILKPSLLIPLLLMGRRAEGHDEPAHPFDRTRMTVVQTAAVVTGVVGTGFGLGFSFDLVVPAMLLATLAAAVITARSARRVVPMEAHVS